MSLKLPATPPTNPSKAHVLFLGRKYVNIKAVPDTPTFPVRITFHSFHSTILRTKKDKMAKLLTCAVLLLALLCCIAELASAQGFNQFRGIRRRLSNFRGFSGRGFNGRGRQQFNLSRFRGNRGGNRDGNRGGNFRQHRSNAGRPSNGRAPLRSSMRNKRRFA